LTLISIKYGNPPKDARIKEGGGDNYPSLAVSISWLLLVTTATVAAPISLNCGYGNDITFNYLDERTTSISLKVKNFHSISAKDSTYFALIRKYCLPVKFEPETSSHLLDHMRFENVFRIRPSSSSDLPEKYQVRSLSQIQDILTVALVVLLSG
jgi:hypothetical protein